MVTDFYNDFRIIYQTEKCIACDSIVVGSSSFSFKVWTDDFSRKISIYECGFCGLAYSYPFLSGAEEKKLYKDYPSHHTHEDVLENKIDLFQKVKVFFENHIAKTFFCSRKPWIRKILSCFLFQRMFQGYPIFFKNEENPKVLDIGCGDGYFLGIAQKFGYFCYGTEFHHGIVRKLEKRKIIAKKYLGDFINNEQFDVIRMSHVLEHLKEPNQALQDIRQLLKMTEYL